MDQNRSVVVSGLEGISIKVKWRSAKNNFRGCKDVMVSVFCTFSTMYKIYTFFNSWPASVVPVLSTHGLLKFVNPWSWPHLCDSSFTSSTQTYILLHHDILGDLVPRIWSSLSLKRGTTKEQLLYAGGFLHDGIRKLLPFITTEADISIYIISITTAFLGRRRTPWLSYLIACEWTEPSNACQTAQWGEMIRWNWLRACEDTGRHTYVCRFHSCASSWSQSLSGLYL